VYENPEWTAEERNAHWLSLEAKFMPWRHNGDLANANTGRAWQSQRHVYFQPFYYIDYCLAETVALQFWQLAEADRTEAMRLYRELCSLGGTKAFQGLVAEVGLKSPLKPGTLQSIAADVARALGL
jgi:oligoendopeptidase F